MFADASGCVGLELSRAWSSARGQVQLATELFRAYGLAIGAEFWPKL